MLDLIIRNGTVFDGSGGEPVRADVAVHGARVVAVDRIRERAKREIDASDLFVAPGFVDAHTHLDAQIFWEPGCPALVSHGVTTAVMGNCGFSLAPASFDDRDLVFRSLERAEDMSRLDIVAGVPWTWTTFAEYVDAVEALPLGLNCAGYVGHSAVRAHVMGERAFEEQATSDDLDRMAASVEAALRAGAIGFSTSRSSHHMTVDGGPVASRVADWQEVRRLVGASSQAKPGIFQLAPERLTDHEARSDFVRRMAELLNEHGKVGTFALVGDADMLDAINENLRTGRAVGQVHVRGFQNILSFETALPFDNLPTWRTVRDLPITEQISRMSDPAIQQTLVDEASRGTYKMTTGAEPRPPDFDRIFPADNASASVAELATSSRINPVQYMIERAVRSDFKQCFRQPLTDIDEDSVLTMLKRDDTLVAASDAGAHVSQVFDCDIPAYLLGHWVRELGVLGWSEAIRMLTRAPADFCGLSDRGRISPRAAADLVVFDPHAVGSSTPAVTHDLPAGGARLSQHGVGIEAVVVDGVVSWSAGVETGNRAGRFIRGQV